MILGYIVAFQQQYLFPGKTLSLGSESVIQICNMICICELFFQISNAVRFLQNPKVRESPFTQRKAFLAKKGKIPEVVEVF